MTWNMVVTKPAQKDRAGLPVKERERIEAALSAMRENPFSGDIVRLKGQPAAWRRRVGSYRILYDVLPDRLMIVVLAIKRRTTTTY